MAEPLNVAEAKSRFSELLNRASYGGERFLVMKRGRPVAAIISSDDLARLENCAPLSKPRGLLAAAGLFADFDGWDEIVDDIMRSRETAADRPVSLE